MAEADYLTINDILGKRVTALIQEPYRYVSFEGDEPTLQAEVYVELEDGTCFELLVPHYPITRLSIQSLHAIGATKIDLCENECLLIGRVVVGLYSAIGWPSIGVCLDNDVIFRYGDIDSRTGGLVYGFKSDVKRELCSLDILKT